MASLLERLNEALPSNYRAERELARGGMGVVFLARDISLQRPVAIKVLLPDLATSRAAAQFLREARILARLSPHPHIVPVHRVEETGGLFFYVMAYIEGETLRHRIAKGRLARQEAVLLGRDLLHALEAVHTAGVVHRDIKPDNILLHEGHALLGDFGIAKPPAGEGTTDPGDRQGTVPYMAPEQLHGEEATTKTDLYAVGLVVYEALTGQRWARLSRPDRKTWVGVPWSIQRVLQRALAPDPADRWPDARTFRRRLSATKRWPYVKQAARDAALLATAAIIITAVAMRDRDPRSPPPGSLTIRLRPFQQTGDLTRQGLADSLSQRLDRSLRLVSEFRVLARDTLPNLQAAVELQGHVASTDSTVSWQVWSESWGKSLRRLADEQFTAGDWKIVADSVSIRTIRELWSDDSPLARWLPRDALPATPQGFDEWLRAERLLNGGHWRDAQGAFHAAVAIDSTCFLCSWRVAEVDRWITGTIDSLNRQRVLDNYHLFPPHFRRLIRARLELTDRLDTLRLATEEWGEYYYAWWLRGEEEYNRGPLAGLLRAEAAISLEKAADLRPEFAPIWWDLAFIHIAEGHVAQASRALQSMPEPLDEFSTVVTMLLGIAFDYRFGDERGATQNLRELLVHPELSRYPDLASVPRWMPYFGAMDGAVRAGGVFADLSDRPNLRRSGLIGQLFGLFAMGQMDAARGRARVYQLDFPDDEFKLFFAQLEAVNSMFDSVGATGDVERFTGQLERYAAPGAGTLEQRLSARWILQLLSQRNAAVAVQTTGADLSDSTTGVHALDVLLEADRMARDDRPQDALRLADTIRTWEIAEVVPDRFFRTVLHFLLADWYTAQGNLQAAVEELRWHEALDMDEHPNEMPLVQEIDWAFGTLARWKRARLLDRLSDTGGETCSAYGAVARLWAEGDGDYVRRSREARARFDELACG